MKTKFVLKDDLGDILESIAEEAIEHSHEVIVEIAFFNYVGVPTMKVRTAKNGDDYATLNCSEYRIIDNLTDDCQISDETVGAGLKALEEIKAKEAAAEENN